MSDFIPHPAGSEIGRKALDNATIQNKYIEHGAYCDNAKADGCTLDSGVRGRLIAAYQQNVLAAQSQFTAALTEIHLEALLEKPEDVPIFISLALDGLALFIGSAVGKAIKMLRTAPASTLSAFDILRGKDDEQHKMMDLVRTADPMWLASMGISQGKKAAAGVLQAPNEDAKQTISYANQISDAAVIAFEHQRQDPPGYADDAELIALFHTWSAAMGNTKNQYKAMLVGKISRFKASGASKVGRQFTKADGDNVVRDTKLVAIMAQDGESEPEIWLYKRDYSKAWFTSEDMNEPQSNHHEEDARDASYVRWKRVEPEFLDEAIAANQAAWGVPYEKQYAITDYAKFMGAK